MAKCGRLPRPNRCENKTYMRKEIDVIVKYFYPVAAGIETNILETYSVLVKKGWNVTIHTSKDTYLDKNSLSENETIRGLKVKRYPFRWWGFWPKIDWDNAGLVCLHNFDIFPHFEILLFVLFKKVLGRKKFGVVLTPHGGFSLNDSWNVFPFWQRIIKKTYHVILAPKLVNFSVDKIRAVSEWEKIEMIKKGIKREKVTVVSNGIENEAYRNVERLVSASIRSQVRKWGNYIIQVGRVYPIKNYETAIRALTLIPKSIKFVIVGPVEKNKFPKYWDNLQSLITQLKLTERVIFAGVIRGVDKYYAMKHARLMVHMALWESFCNVVHEGMSQGLPIVAANNTALPLLIKDGVNGFLVETYDYKKVAKMINFILDKKNSEAIKKMAKANVLFTKDKTWSKTAEKMEILYSSLLLIHSTGEEVRSKTDAKLKGVYL
mgnify:CR=1 FL=1